MPGRDGTGPRGMGPLTGWGRGDCVGMEPGAGWYGMGRGRRYRCWQGVPYASPYASPPRDEMVYLENISLQLEQDLKCIRERMEALRALPRGGETP